MECAHYVRELEHEPKQQHQIVRTAELDADRAADGTTALN